MVYLATKMEILYNNIILNISFRSKANIRKDES